MHSIDFCNVKFHYEIFKLVFTNLQTQKIKGKIKKGKDSLCVSMQTPIEYDCNINRLYSGLTAGTAAISF